MRKVIITMSVVLGLVLGGLFPVSSFVYFEAEKTDCTVQDFQSDLSNKSCERLEA